MSSRTCDLLAAALALALAACGSGDRRTIDICGRGDRPELADALADGTLAVEVLDDDGDVVSSGEAPAGDADRIELDFAGGERVRVTGRDASGSQVAIGEGALGGDGACVCLALSRQAAAACGGLSCLVEADSCRFVDDATGETAGARAFALEVERDTLLVAAAPDEAHGAEPSLAVERAQSVGLVWFDLTQIPARSIVDGVELELSWDAASPGRPPRPLAIHRVLEPWSDEATWNQRAAGEPWSTAGCGGDACSAEPLARMATDGGATTRSLPLGLALTDWLDPAKNHGLALLSEGNPTVIHAAEAGAGAGAARLLVTFHLPDDDLPDPAGGPICGNGLVEADEECDDGDQDDDDACAGCRLAFCGDGLVRAGVEECDHGGSPDASCSAMCLVCDDPQAAASYASESGHCYNLYLDPIVRHYVGAEEYCDQHDHGQIASLGTPKETDDVIAGLDVPPTTPLWIGLSDRDDEGEWIWASGYPVGVFDRWSGTEPSNGAGEDCVMLTNGSWTDNGCAVDRGFICERIAWAAGDGGSAYRVIRKMESFANAELICEASGAHLAAPTSAAENATLTGAFPPEGTDGFIGIGELVSDGVLTWVTGEATGFTNFPSPPDLAGEEWCAYLDPTGWLATGCSRLRRFICESD